MYLTWLAYVNVVFDVKCIYMLWMNTIALESYKGKFWKYGLYSVITKYKTWKSKFNVVCNVSRALESIMNS